MADNLLVPSYLELDFDTYKSKIISQLNDAFPDVAFEGSNISTLIEFDAYLAELFTYYLNRLAKNSFLETADQYETASMHSKQDGYEPTGYVAATTNLTFTITVPTADGIYFKVGDQLLIEQFRSFSAISNNNNTLSNYYFTNPKTFLYTISTVNEISVTGDNGEIIPSYSTELTGLEVLQGSKVEYSYTGYDIVDNQLILPYSNFAHNSINTDSIQLIVNGETWERVENFYDGISGLAVTPNNAYRFLYDKYKRYVIEFSSSRIIPELTDTINIILIVTEGKSGAINKNLITVINSSNLIKNISTGSILDQIIPDKYISVTNPEASLNAADPETKDDILRKAKQILQTQERTVSQNDYSVYLKTHDDVCQAYVYSEQDLSPSGSILNFNKIHVVTVPTDWTTDITESGSITVRAGTWTITPGSTSATIYEPIYYDSTYRESLAQYLEPRKMICTYEVFDLPQLVYFTFDISIRIKKNYFFNAVAADIINKLEFYFQFQNRAFAEYINFMDIQQFILDTTQVSNYDEFLNIKGIDYLVIRKINCNNLIYPAPNYGEYSSDYPQYTTNSSGSISLTDDINILKVIKLGPKQIAQLARNGCTVSQELI